MSAEHKIVQVLSDTEALLGFTRLNISMVITNPNVPDNPIVYVNDAFERTTGYSRSSAIGRNCRFLQGEKTDKRDVDKIRTAIAEGRDVSLDILNYRANGEPFRNRLILAPVLNKQAQPQYIIGIQKELREDDHGADNRIESENLELIKSRVHNDLAMILQSIAALRDDNMMSLAAEVEALPRRLETLQLIYEEMKLSDRQWNSKGIDLGSLLSRLASAIAHHESRVGIRFVQSVDNLEVNLETATRVALVLSEALNNAFRHAFVGLDHGFVELRAQRLAAGGMRLTVSDDGVGLPKNTAWPQTNTAGGRLMNSLLDGLDGTIAVARGAAGTVVMIDVPVGFTDKI